MVCSISSVALVNEMVPRTTGAIVWLPGRGVNSCYRMGIVPAGTTSDGAGTFPANTRPYFRTGNGPLKYWSPLPIPYNNRIASDVIEFSPSLVDSNISRARLYAGYMSVQSDTAPVGVIALNGTLSAAAVSDITDVFQPATYNYGTASTNGALDISQLVQSAVLVKDCVKEVAVSKGITAVIGPDIAASLNDTDFNTTFVQNGRLLRTIDLKDAGLLPKATIGNLNPNTTAEQWSGWVSPWNTTLTGTWGNFSTVNMANFNAGPINPFGGCLAFEVQFNLTHNNAAGVTQPTGYMENWVVHFYHVFASCSSDGSITYNTVLDTQPMMVYNMLLTGASTYKIGQWRLTAKSNPKPHMGQPNVYNNAATWQPVANGMYIGTQINISSSNLTNVTATDKGWVIDPDTNPCIIVYSVNDQVPGELGPCRVVRYDNLSAGQILKVDGSFMAECLPGATTAPFVQASGSMARVCSNVNALSFLSFAYNSDDTPFRRCWVTNEWEEYKSTYLPNINAKVIRSFSTARLLMAAAAAGVLTEGTCEDDEGNGLGMDVSSVAGGILPTAIGTVVGKTASSVVGSALKRSRSMVNAEPVDNSHDKYLKAQIEGAVIKALGTNPLFTPSNVAARLSQLDRVMDPVGTERSKALLRAAYNEQQ